jgi:predicted alpha/beta superfamily hydrolase
MNSLFAPTFRKALSPALLISLLLTFLSFGQTDLQIRKKAPLTIGETLEFYSPTLRENRTLNVYLPLGYDKEPTKQYPVIYLLDGSLDEDLIHVAGLVQFGSFPWIEMLPESIVIGIANVDRRRDFTFPTTIEKDKKDFPTTGHSAEFIRFLEKDLQPLVTKQYRTTASRTIIGQSLGGLLATEVLYEKPELFDHYIIVSPSLWWDNESLLQKKLPAAAGTRSVYIGAGKEGPIMERDAQNLHGKLKQLNPQNPKLFYQYFEDQDHGDALHLAVYDAFEKLFRVKKK